MPRKRRDESEAVKTEETKEIKDPWAVDESEDDMELDNFEEDKEEPKEEEKPQEPQQVSDLPSIPLKVFVKVAGPKWDQMAGFIHYAKINNLTPRTIPEWRESYKNFLQRPIK